MEAGTETVLKTISLGDNEELRTLKNVLHVIEGSNPELSISALVRVIQALLVGLSVNREEAEKFFDTVVEHVKGQLLHYADEDFGNALPEVASDDPILAEEEVSNIIGEAE